MRHFHSRVYLLLCLLAKYGQLNLGLLWEAKVSVGWTEMLLLVLVITLFGPTGPRWFSNCPLNDSHASERKTESLSLLQRNVSLVCEDVLIICFHARWNARVGFLW